MLDGRNSKSESNLNRGSTEQIVVPARDDLSQIETRTTKPCDNSVLSKLSHEESNLIVSN